MKIALVLEPSGGGSGRHVLDLTEAFLADGHAVTVFWSPVRAETDFVNRLMSIESATVIEVPMQRSVGLHDVAGLFALKAAIARHGPFDVVHAHSSKAGALVRMLPRKVAPVRVYTPHALRTMDPDISGKAALVFGKVEALLAKGGDPLIAVSQAEKDHALTLGIRPEQVTVVPNGARPKPGLDRAGAAEVFGTKEDDFVVGFIGRMAPQKDPLRFVEAVVKASENEPRLRGVVMGDGDLMADAQARAKDAPVTFLGWCDAPALVAGLDVLCVTSRYEALAYSFLEALHAGVPIVSANVGGVAETVIPGETGLVLDVDASAEDFATALLDLSQPSKRAAFSKASNALAARRTIEAMAQATLDVYRKAGATDAATKLAGAAA